ncbi:MAG: ribonucleoside-diphosphate reductase subunit alpha [Gammaproteobacteria bacterium]|nr:ribonucleoside-diphosphate reductase subunit alpha [Gammaproteobacteria bacterium]|tara:strand:- start:501 stop:3152 length:2652 start_codon:yes stop_codon:yes gene_type:complete
MRVEKRNGNYEDVSFDKILKRIQLLCIGEEFKKKLSIDPTVIAQKVCSEIYDNVKTTELDELSSQIAISMYSKNPEYATLASRIVVSNHHKRTNGSFSSVIEELYENNIIQEYLYTLVNENREMINNEMNPMKDYELDFFGFKTLEKSYLLKINGCIVERPQYLFMRVALCIHRDNLEKAFETYHHISNKDFIHATPTLFNAGTKREQLASCFLLAMKEDSVDGIYDTLKDCAKISKYSGGIGLHIHNIRANHSFINGTNGYSNGIVPMLRVFNDTARYIDQGGGKRNGSFAIYLEPWHSDILEFLELKKNHGNELERARDLFYGLWIPDLFMERVEAGGQWTLMCPDECPGLSDCYGSEFVELYERYENEGKGKDQIDAQKLWFAILNSQIETGTPYLLYKDACNSKSNQNNLGTIKSSNLCTEIIEYSNKEETAVCNLASISLPSCLEEKDTSDLILTIYSKPDCCYCRYAKTLCDSLDLTYEIKDYKEITLSPSGVHGVTFPKIYRDGNILIGGYTELVDYLKPVYNYQKLKDLSKVLTYNLNKIIDYNYYPIPETKRSNERHRPIGIGVQGLANVFYEMKIPFDSDESKEVNQKIFESIYYGSLEASMEIARDREEGMRKLKIGAHQLDNDPNYVSDEFITSEELYQLRSELKPLEIELERDEYLGTYSSFIGSPLYHGKLQFDLWNETVDNSLFDWDTLRVEIKKYGVRNSLLVAPMPTASTSQILGNYECIEPVISNIYSRRVLAGEFMVINEYLVKDLILLEKWSPELKDKIIINDGSIQGIEEIPQFIKDRYKTAWEIKQKDIMIMAADRGKFICQSQSLNLFVESPNYKILSSMHFYGWKKGLKTGMYYLRTRPSSKALQFTVEPEQVCESCSA